MTKELSSIESSPVELRELIKWAVALLGQIIEKKLGPKAYKDIEALRSRMANLRDQTDSATFEALSQDLEILRKLKPTDRMNYARAFTLMLELTNICENAYRSHRLSIHTQEKLDHPSAKIPTADALIYVLTAHPTEARSPQNIAVFRGVQSTLVQAFQLGSGREKLAPALGHQLHLAWQVSATRMHAPQVRDEASHIYSILFSEGTIESLLEASRDIVPLYIRTWVGGDKDGHPGVDQNVMHESLTLSREHLLLYARKAFAQVNGTLALLPNHPLRKEITQLGKLLMPLHGVKASDGKKVQNFRDALHRFSEKYQKQIGAAHPLLQKMKHLLHVFPGLVVPLELRESSDVLMSSPKIHTRLAIDKMLKKLATISKGGDPKWYARGFIVSMTENIEHLQVAHRKVKAALGTNRIPVIPLFEQAGALDHSVTIAQQMIHDSHIGKSLVKEWNNTLELMVGYSDSSKESGVLPSRLAIAKAMNLLDETCTKEKVKALFFQGSGGSVDRGGGTVQDQTAWWPMSALKWYKVTVQGEMVERSLANASITRGQIERIAESISESLDHTAVAPHNPTVEKFSKGIAQAYKKIIQDPQFLEVVAKATPYSDLTELKLGSRPSKRATGVSVAGLRAIPWVLCWTQTRVLFQTWWGVGSSWKDLNEAGRLELRKAFKSEPVFSSFVRALGFTLAKVELGVWRVYLQESGLSPEMIENFYDTFKKEYALAQEFFQFVTEEKDLLWFRPWLGASIRLRSPMIHPLNLLQVLAIQSRDFNLLRYTVMGVSSGMLTTG